LTGNLYWRDVDASGIRSHFAYDSNNQLTLVSHQLRGRQLASFGYEYRADGRIGVATGDRQAAYDYDGVKQLIEESDSNVRSGYDGAGNRMWRAALPPSPAQMDSFDWDNRLTNMGGTTYAYDNNGNLLAADVGGIGVKYTYDGANRLASIDNGTTVVNYLYDV